MIYTYNIYICLVPKKVPHLTYKICGYLYYIYIFTLLLYIWYALKCAYKNLIF